MTLTRWKLMAGVLGISIVGVVAMASPQCPNTKKDAARETAPPSRAVDTPAKGTSLDGKKYERYAVTLKDPNVTPPLPAVEVSLPSPDARIEFAAPPALGVASPVAPALPPAVTDLALPKIEQVAPLPLVGATPLKEIVKVEPPKSDEIGKGGLGNLGVGKPVSDPPTLTLPGGTVPDVLAKAEPPKLDLPKLDTAPPKPDRVVELALPGVPAVKPTAPVPELPLATEPKPTAPPAITFSEPAVATPPATPKKAEPVGEKPARTPAEDAAVRIVIHLGTGQPKFDVMSGDDALLKAVCNNIDIRSPNENGAGVTPLKAGGKVQFSAPGCEGTCDSLTVLPTTGEVELAGNVKVHCRLGKGSTEINATTMKFKLGSAPAYTVPEPAVTPVAGVDRR